ncbi:phosphatase PAP2 family protein [Nocardioides jiangxiensis]|uniref:Phosphatase PAP2 family protein n=1 Tax=Nocardioides jiangxiensis TaxID=3064524 RepID=A0ABT9B1D7_9ACTN|nr:phosphatase PAP2 family protein [Nocardioides sp. WY-20]MDO7868537.1 phosphatase PAP2 family protein [Nocardioides sp. WY-20]
MHRRAYVLLIGVATMMGALALITALALDKKLVDPDGFLGPSWLRLPLLVGGALLLDMLPRVLWHSRLKPALMWPIVRDRWTSHWNRERLTLVLMGLICFYVTYVSYRNLKSFLPEVMGLDRDYDRPLHEIDRFLFFGHEPAIVLHDLLGTSFVAYFLSYIYLWFLPLVPLALAAWLVWSRNISFGYWFATSQVLAWTLGTASYYLVPSVGPGFEYSWLYDNLDNTPASQLMNSLYNGRESVLRWGADVDAVQSVAAFASLHCAITLLVALMVQYTIKTRWVHWVGWVNFGITVVATLYFGWHYVSDDVAGIVIALLSFYLGGLASGQKFDRHGLSSHPTTTSSIVPVDDD